MQLDLSAGARIARTGRRAFDSVWNARALSSTVTTAARLRAQVEALGRVCRELCIAHRVKMHVEGAPPVGPSLIVANHLSYLDPVIIGSLAPALPMAKAEVAHWPFIGPRARALGTLFVVRDDPMSGARVLRQAMRAMRLGVSVLVFPEGTTTWGDMVLPFRSGSFGIARRLRAPIVPVRIDYPDEDLCWVGDDAFLPHYLGVLARKAIQVRVRFGVPFMPGPKSPPTVLAARARSAVARRIALLGELS